MTTAIDLELAYLRRITSRAATAANEVAWRVAMQRRASRISRVLTLLPAALKGHDIDREKGAGSWSFVVDGVPVLLLDVHSPGRTLEDLEAPLRVRVLRAEFLDEAILARLAQRYNFVVEMM